MGTLSSLRGAKRRSNPETTASILWIAHMGSRCVKAIGQLFVRLETSSSSRPWKYGDGARRSSQGRPAGPPRSGLALTRSSTPSGWHGRGGSVGASSFRLSFGDLRFEPVWQSGFACQIKLTFGRRARRTAPRFRLRRAGSRGRSHSSLRLCEAMQSIGSSTRIGRG